MIFASLPDELKSKILKYIFINCDECNNNVLYNKDKVFTDVTTTYYRSLFDDNFPFPRIHKCYKYICVDCINKLKQQYIKPL